MSQIQQFCKGQNIFITGGTGFLGIILTEKLLRSCPDVGTIYLLIRAKKGKTPQERIEALVTNPVFEVVRNEYPDFSKKIVGISGDISEEGLGLSTTDRALIEAEVSVIFHLAATVRFNENINTAIKINVNGVKYIVDIAGACKNLKVAVYVSTAYSHCPRKLIKEQLYPPPMSCEEVNKLVKDSWNDKWTEEEIQNFTQNVVGEWPNSYSFTKAIAEGVVAEYVKEIPFAIFRPSIVINAYREPIPGWLLSVMGLPGLIYAAALGVLHVTVVNTAVRVDLVPVDYVCNALIACAWETAITERRRDEEIPIYNYVSGNQNPITFKQLFSRYESFGRIYPTNSSLYYPNIIYTKSKLIFYVLEVFFHLLPALIIDIFARLLGKKLKVYKIACKIGDAIRAVAYFDTQQWDFENQRVQNLWKRIDPMDKLVFPFDIKNVDWREHCLKMIHGIRTYIAGDPVGNVRQARRRHTILYIIHTIVRSAFALFVLWIVWKLLDRFSLTIDTETHLSHITK